MTVSKLNSFTAGGWGEKATLTIPNGPVYEEIFLETNLTPEQIKRVSITLNGDEIIVLDGKLMKALEAYKGLSSTEGFYSIPLADISAKTKVGMYYTSLVTEPGDNIILEVEIVDKPDENAPTVSLKGYATVSAPKTSRRIIVPQIKTHTMTATSTENEYLDLVSGPFLSVRRMHFLSDKVNEVQIHRDFAKVYESTRPVEMMRAKRNRRFWQPGMYHFDPVMRGYMIAELFKTAHASELKFTVKTDAVPGAIPILVESVKVVQPELLHELFQS